jgi:talin
VDKARAVLDVKTKLCFATSVAEAAIIGKTAVLAIKHLAEAAKGASAVASDPSLSRPITLSVGNTARTMVELLEAVKLYHQQPSYDPKSQSRLAQASDNVDAALPSILSALRKLPGMAQMGPIDGDLVNLDAQAAIELRKCAQVIEESAKKLLAAKPPARALKTPGVLDKLDVTDAILDSATAIARATGSLVSSAAKAQHERTERVDGRNTAKYSNDPTWAQGLISAAHDVSGSVQSLVIAANDAAHGRASEEALVASAKSVAVATAHLVSAAKVKADPDSATQRSLTAAAKAVANATSELVRATQTISFENPSEVVIGVEGIPLGKKLEIEQRMKIIQLERMLEKERDRMAAYNRAKYAAAAKK